MIQELLAELERVPLRDGLRVIVVYRPGSVDRHSQVSAVVNECASSGAGGRNKSDGTSTDSRVIPTAAVAQELARKRPGSCGATYEVLVGGTDVARDVEAHRRPRYQTPIAG